MTKGSGKGKNKSAKLEVRPFMVKNYLWVFVNSMINNPTFDSQVRLLNAYVLIGPVVSKCNCQQLTT